MLTQRIFSWWEGSKIHFLSQTFPRSYLVESNVSQLVDNFEDVKLKRNDKVKTLHPHTIQIRDEVVVVDPRQLFNRIICTATSAEKLEECFEYELSTEAPSIFANGFLRKTKKSTLFSCLEKYIDTLNPIEPTSNEPIYYIDGGFLLHKVVWQPNTTFAQIYNQYECFIRSHYGRGSFVIFDGYDDRISTKAQEQNRRIGSMSCADILFEDSMIPNVSQTKFLNNRKNKTRFIDCLSKTLLVKGYSVMKCKGDADTSIVSTALTLPEYEFSSREAVVVAEDVDILVLLLHHCDSPNVFMYRSFGSRNMIHIQSLQQSLGHLRHCILFLHAASGCDTTSAFFNKGKASTFKLLEKDKQLAQRMSIFIQNKATREEIATLGESFTLQLYGVAKTVNCINKLRYVRFNQITARKSLTKEMDLAALPPTKNSLSQHFYRVYHQIQNWCGNELAPWDWGWTVKQDDIVPTKGFTDVAPGFVMELIFCNCKKSGCQNLCSCRKFGLKCTAQCGNCLGMTCLNRNMELEIDDEE